MVAHFDDPRLRRRQLVRLRFQAGCAGSPNMGDEERILSGPERQPRTSALALSDLDCLQQPAVGGLALAGIEIAQDAEEDGERGQPLEAVDDVERACRACTRPL